MAIELTWLGHGSWSIALRGADGQHTILVDPFLDDSPAAPVRSGDVAADTILVSHGHFDHIADAAKIAKRTGALVISNFEICEWLTKQGVERTHPHNLGGGSQQKFGRVQLTLAHHSSVLPDGTYGGNPSGFLLWADAKKLYFACDTALFYDMKLVGEEGIDVAVLPIGDQFTMGPADSIRAIKLLTPKVVLPSHYNTWPPIAQDAGRWAERVRQETSAEPRVLSPGEKTQL
ncbi:MAG: metal-dependent hydrolase [Planctomycetia bacterium]|nr:metal-dependent hydrolase [Planctomycetia bacterium]